MISVQMLPGPIINQELQRFPKNGYGENTQVTKNSSQRKSEGGGDGQERYFLRCSGRGHTTWEDPSSFPGEFRVTSKSLSQPLSASSRLHNSLMGRKRQY
jgi:hypothetical protein